MAKKMTPRGPRGGNRGGIVKGKAGRSSPLEAALTDVEPRMGGMSSRMPGMPRTSTGMMRNMINKKGGKY